MNRVPGRKSTKKGGSTVSEGAALLRLTLFVGGASLAVWLVPPLRSAAVAFKNTLILAMEVSRSADANRVATARDALRFGISYELAAAIREAALAEGIDPELGYRLIRVESEFKERAVSPVGALGLTQLMPATAAELQPGITRDEIFDRETNLRLGFRYLRTLIRVYDGEVEEALHAYNRGPGTVDRLRARGLDPANGYADRVLGRAEDRYRGNGMTPTRI